MSTPERIWADARSCTVYMDGSSPIAARDREFRNSTEYVRADLVAELTVTEAMVDAAERTMAAHYERPLNVWELAALLEALTAALEAGKP